MKGKKVSTKYKARLVLSLAVASQFSLSLSTLAAIAEAESISNSSLPLAQPSPSQRVQKIWSSLDVRKFAKKKDNNSQEAEKTPAKTETASEDTSSAGVTGTAQAVFKTTEETSAAPVNVTAQDKESAVSAEPFPSKDAAISDGSAPTVPSISAEANSSTSVTSVGEAKISPDTHAKEALKVEAAAPSTKPIDGEISVNSLNKDESIKSEGPIRIASNIIQLPPGSVLSKVQGQETALIVDNDEAQEVEETIKAEEMATDDGKTHAKAGARFPVVLASQINSKTAKKGDPLTAKLKYDLKIGDRLVAKKGSVVNGHVNYVLHARTIMHSLVSPERWYRNSGCIGLTFDEIINDKGEHLPLSAQPSRQARIVKNKGEGRELGVNQYGQVTGPWAQQIRYKAIRIGLNAALTPAGVFSFGAMPVALGVLGAANPSFAFSRPVGLNVRHRRIKGFAWGFLSGIPGSWLIEDTTVKGQEAIVKPGDEFYAELVQEFTGEPATDAQLMPGASTKLHGQVLSDPKKDKKKKK